METDLSSHFVLLGVDPDAVEVYLELLHSGYLDVPDSADERTVRSLAVLIDVGLVARDGACETRYVPVPPETGLRALTSRRESQISQAMVAVQNAYRDFRRQQQLQQPAGELVEVVTGPAILQRLKQAEDHAHTQIRRLDSPPYYRIRSTNTTELDHLRRGIAYRVVYAQASLATENYLDGNIVPSIKAGEQARVLQRVPVKLSIIDDSVACVSLSITEADVNRTLLIVRPSTLFTALVGLFELCWQTATPIMPTGALGSNIEPSEQRMLSLLAAGMTDEDVIRTLRISRRTFFRHLERLQARAGVDTRFQLGVYASRHGWLPDLPA